MNSPAAFKKGAQREATDRQSDALTHVELIWFEKRTEYWIRFGQQAGERVIDRRRRVVSFAPGQVFAFVRWASNDYGTVLSCIDILRAVCRGEPYQTLPSVQPGGDVLLTITGWPKVERVLQVIDAIEAFGIDPVDVTPDHWRHVHNRMAARQTPRTYTQTRHAAWIKRRRVGR
ncbi:DUF2840 domain-containing protein [Pararhizobium sp. IMCC21322]|uniref:DUF2840 domain-containing protein n=1 Tax=Pararhizobium sp. IMCC21322 TaxID=3067903 RepID=UPI002740F2BB|nr:DUF2840 domain-containing protein [Pararhizobium sp. IMCC21322]